MEERLLSFLHLLFQSLIFLNERLLGSCSDLEVLDLISKLSILGVIFLNILFSKYMTFSNSLVESLLACLVKFMEHIGLLGLFEASWHDRNEDSFMCVESLTLGDLRHVAEEENQEAALVSVGQL